MCIAVTNSFTDRHPELSLSNSLKTLLAAMQRETEQQKRQRYHSGPVTVGYYWAAERTPHVEQANRLLLLRLKTVCLSFHQSHGSSHTAVALLADRRPSRQEGR